MSLMIKDTHRGREGLIVYCSGPTYYSTAGRPAERRARWIRSKVRLYSCRWSFSMRWQSLLLNFVCSREQIHVPLFPKMARVKWWVMRGGLRYVMVKLPVCLVISIYRYLYCRLSLNIVLDPFTVSPCIGYDQVRTQPRCDETRRERASCASRVSFFPYFHSSILPLFPTTDWVTFSMISQIKSTVFVIG